MVKVKPNFIKVSHEKGTLKVVPVGGYRWAELIFKDFRGEIIRVAPQLFGKFLVLGVSKEIDPQTARNILELLQEEVPKFYRLKAFLLKEPPEGGDEETDQLELEWFNIASAGLYCSDDGSYYEVSINENGDAECSCGKFKSGTWCRHIRFVHRVFRTVYSPDLARFPYHLPLWPIKELSEGAKLITTLGGSYHLLSESIADPSSYNQARGVYYTPMLGVEFEIPRRQEPEIFFLRRIITALKEKGVVSSYERDASVEGGEIKLKPFPAKIEECLEKGNLLKAIREVAKPLFEDERLAGMHVHINMYPFASFSTKQIERRLSPIVRLFERRFNLAVLFGRIFNRYALRMEEVSEGNARYGWINYRPLPYTVEVRLGCAKKGDPVKILLISLLLQKAFWAKLEGNFKVPPLKASRGKILSAFAELLSEEERKHIVPLLEEALI
ncbi:SWIM zinc finger family protein [Thermocrinis sp.]|jgi:hypothetical protein|uniref:SWIM zinc finger family protein n=1 Tax=Thermocrinis sp. TaxID=2024383 RepID=UPI003C006F75